MKDRAGLRAPGGAREGSSERRREGGRGAACASEGGWRSLCGCMGSERPRGLHEEEDPGGGPGLGSS